MTSKLQKEAHVGAPLSWSPSVVLAFCGGRPLWCDRRVLFMRQTESSQRGHSKENTAEKTTQRWDRCASVVVALCGVTSECCS